jgi:signal transduction histidine kinase
VTARRDAQLATALLGLRTPLARIQLAASRMCRDGFPPLARSCGEAICDAVGELDGRLELAVAALAGEPAPTPSRDCEHALEQVLRRVAPAFEARGCSCEQLPTAGSVLGDEARVRRGALQLLRVALRHAGPGGRVQVGLVDSAARYGLRVNAQGPEARQAEQLGEPLAALRRFALARGGELELETVDGGGLRAALWFFRQEPGA